MHLREYACAIYKDWVARMSGPASILLAFWAAYFPPARPVLQATLWLAAVLCFIFASYRIWVKEHNSLLAKQYELDMLLDTRAKRKSISEQLSELFREGDKILTNCVEVHVLNLDKLEAWNVETERFIRENLGNAYAVRLLSKSGIKVYPLSVPGSARTHVNRLHTWLERIDEFIKEVRPDLSN
jgi:hypothetical protein